MKSTVEVVEARNLTDRHMLSTVRFRDAEGVYVQGLFEGVQWRAGLLWVKLAGWWHRVDRQATVTLLGDDE